MLYLPKSCPRPREERARSFNASPFVLFAPLVVPLLATLACGEGHLGQGGSRYTNGAAAPAPAPAPTPAPPPQPVPTNGGSIDNPAPYPAPMPMPAPSMNPMTPPAPTPMPMPMPTPSGLPPLPTPNILVSEIEMPTAVRQILERRCSACHTYGERDPIGWGSVLDLSRMISADVVVPGDPDHSRMWNRVAVRADMPYNGQRLTAPELQVLRSWIGNLNRPTQKPRSHEELLDAIVADQAKQKPANDYRYVSFAHFADERRAPEELQSAVSVFSVVLNSLSRKATLVRPEPADPGRTLYRFRLSDLGWGQDEWDKLISFYPYCLRSDKAPHRTLYDRLQTEAPYLRGDWFIATATKPPLYEFLLDIPATLQELEEDLRIDIKTNLEKAKPEAVRIGFRSSGVSAHNRMIERHKLGNAGGFFWISYDFNSDVDRADLRENPLGPLNLNIKNFQNAFDHAGGEVIYTLPNGMQAYLLVNAAGTRIDTAPKEIVKDPRRRPGAVENGISCIGCHGVTGMNKPRVYDEILRYAEDHKNRFPKRELDEIRALYPTNGDQILSEDAARYLKVMEAAGGARVDPGTIEYDAFINLVGQYEGKVGLRAGAMELGLDVAAARALVTQGRNEDALPIELGDPLVTRDDFVCRMRRIMPTIGARAQFCRGTFTEQQVRQLCE
jgi:mono/diheme cytochrome c family protein